jgi:hypothetical protein
MEEASLEDEDAAIVVGEYPDPSIGDGCGDWFWQERDDRREPQNADRDGNRT